VGVRETESVQPFEPHAQRLACEVGVGSITAVARRGPARRRTHSVVRADLGLQTPAMDVRVGTPGRPGASTVSQGPNFAGEHRRADLIGVRALRAVAIRGCWRGGDLEPAILRGILLY